MTMLGLHCCVQAFSSCDEQELLSSCNAQASRYDGFFCFGAWALEQMGSVVVEHGLSCPAACGILPDQGLNPCPLH